MKNPFQKKSLRRNAHETIQKFSFASLAHQKKQKPPRSFWKIVSSLFLLFFSLGLIGLSVLLFVVLKDLPDVSNPEALLFSESTVIYDREGKVQLYAIHGDQNRRILPIQNINQNMINAILSAEDDAFFTHDGFDFGGISMAFCHEIFGNLGGMCPQRGGSTITQQVIKNFFLTPERTIVRKLREIVLAYKIEHQYSKEEILGLYLNGISFGSAFHGVETASQAYFSISASELSPAQAAILASLPKEPTRLSPYGEQAFSHVLLDPEIIQKNNLETFDDVNAFSADSWRAGLVGREIPLANGKTAYFEGRSDWVIKRMHSLGYLSDAKYEQAQEELKIITFSEYREAITAPHFVMWIRQQLEEKYGPDLIQRGGLRVITTLDVGMQEKAEEAIQKSRQKNTEQYKAKNAALVAMDPQTGEIRALVGSADYWDKEIDGNVNVILKKRLPGSSFKPIDYAAAFLAGKLSPASILFDVETDFGNGWKPKNFDGTFRGPVSVRKALGNSLNIPAIKATIIAGPEKVYEMATNLGIHFDQEPDFYGAAIALGGAEARPLDMAVAYSAFVNGGYLREPVGILRVEDRSGNILFSAKHEVPQEEEPVLNPAVSYLVADMLSDPNARGPGWNSRLQLPGRWNIVKTGTADKKVKDVAFPADCWTIGGTPDLITAVWTGNSTGEVLGSRASGFEIAAPIWYSFMTEAFQGIPSNRPPLPQGITSVLVSKLSGLLPSEGFPKSLLIQETFATANIPSTEDTSLSFVEVDSISGKLPSTFTPKDAIEKRAVPNLHSYYPDRPEWENPVQEWLTKNRETFLTELGIGEDISATIPTEQDDVHTQKTRENAPRVSFVNPTEGGNVSAPRMAISIDANIPNGFHSVRFFVDDRLLKSFDAPEEQYVIPIARSASDKIRLRVEVQDTLLYSGSAEITVSPKKDTSPPDVSITVPHPNESFSGGTSLLFSADAVDIFGAVQKVEFFVNNERIGADLFAPFEWEWESPNTDAEYVLLVVATDYSGNQMESSAPFRIRKTETSETFKIRTPQNGSIVSCGESIRLEAGTDTELRNDFDHLELWGEGNGEKKRIANFSELTATGIFTATFSPEKCGEWRFYLKAFRKNASPRISGRISVRFQ
ncbi:transglycosylase domain-containing protein [Candidatus Peregrinibacteria bacterium]|nr:MAG: transglycosylase domain-containing protein [Candidatus Peregrinibacteria bacterium]